LVRERLEIRYKNFLYKNELTFLYFSADTQVCTDFKEGLKSL